MKKAIRLSLISFTSVCLLALVGVFVYANFIPRTITISSIYAAETKNPDWAINLSELVITGTVISKDPAQKGVDPDDSKQVLVFTDTNIKVMQVLKNKSGKNIKEGDVIAVRTLGGTAYNITLKTETDSLFADNGDVLLALVDGTKDRILPITPGKQYYSVVGGINGSYDLKPDGTAERRVVKDKFQQKDLLDKVQKAK